MADERTPDGGAPRPARPALRLARRSGRLGAAGRLGNEVASARAPGRIVRAATRLSPGPPAAPPAPAAAPGEAALAATAAAVPAGMSAWQAAWIMEGDATKAAELSTLPDANEVGRKKLQRSRGARIIEGPASGHAEPTAKEPDSEPAVALTPSEAPPAARPARPAEASE